MTYLLWSIPSALLGIFMIIVCIILFQKAGVPGWKAIIPFYNAINFFDIMKTADDFWGMCLTGGFVLILGFIIPYAPLKYALLIIGSILCLIFVFIICLRGAKRFGKTSGFGVGMALLPFIFLSILALGSATYNKEA